MFNNDQALFIERYLGISIPPGEIEQPGQTPDDPRLADLRKAFEARKSEAGTLAESLPEQAGILKIMVGTVADCLDGGFADAAKDGLYELAAMIKRLETQRADLDALAAASPVALNLCAIDWRKACAGIADEVDAIREAMLDEIDEPDTKAQASKLSSLSDRLLGEGSQLSDAIRAVVDAPDTGERKDAARTALGKVDTALGFISGSALLAHLVGNPLDDADDPQFERNLVVPLTTLRAKLNDLI